MAKTLIGIFDDLGSARNAYSELSRLGLPEGQIRFMNNEEVSTSPPTDRDGDGNVGVMEKVQGWFSALFDDDDDVRQADTYAEAYRRGHYLVVADVENDWVEQCVAIMQDHGAIDIDRRKAQWSKTGYKGFDRTAQPLTGDARVREMASYRTDTNKMSIPVVQEELSVGKRVVSRGGVRVHSYVQERPVEEVVRLREERVNVQRRSANRPATAADMAFQNRSVDVTAVGEVPVVGKTARVVEEVLVDKDVGQRTETVKETVRRKDVKVDKIDSQRGASPRR